MRGARIVSLGTAAGFLALALLTLADRGRAEETKDPLAAEIERWSVYLRGNTSTDEMWTQVKQGTEPGLARAGEALKDGRRLLALQRLAAARVNLAATVYLDQRPADQRNSEAGLESEWTRLGQTLRDDLAPPSPRAFDGVAPAAVRAMGEAAFLQVRVYYEASLEYGRSTAPRYGLFYLGVAESQRQFAAFCRTLSAPSSRRAPAVRALRAELDALEAEILAAYRPPASIDKHSEFIAASAALKEARELDAAGLRYGALLRYLQAAQRLAAIVPAPGPFDRVAIARRLSEAEARFSTGGVDHTIGALLVETARADLAATVPDATPSIAAAIGSDVIPRYLAALEPARREPARPAPRVTVTLVRWPYT
jgi:hypothetical protein